MNEKEYEVTVTFEAKKTVRVKAEDPKQAMNLAMTKVSGMVREHVDSGLVVRHATWEHDNKFGGF